jgi:hypothetical protein
MAYFSERERGPNPRTIEDLTEGAWNGIMGALYARLNNGSFGNAFPDRCPDGQGVCGSSAELFEYAFRGQFPSVRWPLERLPMPSIYEALDIVEFCFRNAARPEPIAYHRFYGHQHLAFDVVLGRADFREEINAVFSQNHLAFNLEENGQITRVAPVVLREALVPALFTTGDAELDRLLEEARSKFLSPDPRLRQEALERIWDAFERLKTIEPGADKKASVEALLGRAIVEPNLREKVNDDMTDLTRIGNRFMIRHTETDKIPVAESDHVDYLFHRMFAVIRLLLRATNRGG